MNVDDDHADLELLRWQTVAVKLAFIAVDHDSPDDTDEAKVRRAEVLVAHAINQERARITHTLPFDPPPPKLRMVGL